MHTQDLEEEKGAGRRRWEISFKWVEAAPGSSNSGDLGAGAQLTWGKDLSGCETDRLSEGWTTDPDPKALRGPEGSPVSRHTSLSPTVPTAPSHPLRKFLQMCLRSGLSFCPPRNGKAVSIARGLDVAYLSPLKTKQNKSLF